MEYSRTCGTFWEICGIFLEKSLSVECSGDVEVDNVLGKLCGIFWAIIWIVLGKYVACSWNIRVIM